MGWLAAGYLVHDAPLESVVSLLPGDPHATGERVSGERALRLSMLTGPVYGLAETGGWTVVSDPGLQIVYDQEAGERLSANRRALAFLLHSVSAVYGFSLYTDGALTRRALYVEGAPEETTGAPLSAEQGLPHPSTEDHVLALIPRVTGIAWPALVAATYRTFQAG